MDKENYRIFNVWQNEASKLASNIKTTVFGNWVTGNLSYRYNIKARGELNLPTSLPIYCVYQDIIVKTGDTVPQDGIYIPTVQDASAQLLLKGRDAIDASVGLSRSGLQYAHEENTTWTLVERIADTGGSAKTIQAENLKGFGGEICPRSGHWWSPANQSEKHYFEQGEVFPKLRNNFWGKTVWYLEVTNKCD